MPNLREITARLRKSPIPLGLWSLLSFCTSLLLTSPIQATQRLDARAGEIDGSAWGDEESYALYGEWYFAGQELLTPDSFLAFKREGRIFKTTTIGLSLQQSAPDAIKGPTGYGTYILHLKNMPGDTSFALAGIAAYVSARIYVFDASGGGGREPIRNFGNVSSDPQMAKSEITSNTVLSFHTGPEGDYYILIQVANHHHAWGGLWHPPTIGVLPVILSEVDQNLKANYLVFGMMIFIGFYNFILFFFRREDHGNLYLTIICISLLTRTWFFNNYGQDIFGDGYWGVQLSFKVIYVTLFTLAWAAYRSVHNFFPNETPAWMDQIVPPICLLMILFVLLTPSRIFGIAGTPLFVMSVGLGVCSAYVTVRAAFMRRPGSLTVLLGLGAVLTGAVLELLNALNKFSFGRNAMTFGMTFYAACLSLIISKRFSSAFRQAEHLSQELNSEVQRQTRDIRSLLDNLNQGIFTLVEDTLKVGSQFSASLRHIIGRDQIEGLTLRELILDQSELNADHKDRIEAAVQSALGENLLNFEINAEILVRDISFVHPRTQETQHLELDWSPIVDPHERVEKLLISVRDVTEIRQLRAQARLREDDFEILKELVDVAENRFMRFLPQARTFLHDNRLIIAAPETTDSVQRLFINMHSLKGIARSYNLTLLANAVHQAEETLSALRGRKSNWDAARLEAERQAVEAVCNHYERIAQEKLGWAAAGSKAHINKEQLESLTHRLQAIAVHDLSASARRDLARIEMQLLELCHQSLAQVIEEASRGLDSLARSLGKQPPQLSLALDGFILHESTASTLHGIFTHLLRNSLDHGLETGEERVQMGKQSYGRIHIEAQVHEGELQIRYEDDGRGLDLARLEQKAREQGIWKDGKPRSDQDVAELIFLSGLTTKAQVTEISGRGVGMDAVCSMLQNLGGAIHIVLAAADRSERRRFHLILCLPRHAFIPSRVTPPEDIPLRNSPGF